MTDAGLEFVDDSGSYDRRSMRQKIEALTHRIPVGNVPVVMESDRSHETAVRFLALLSAGRVPLMLPEQEFQDQEFVSFVRSVLGAVSLWPLREGLPLVADTGTISSPLLKPGHFIVKTSGTSGLKNKFIVHDLDLFRRKFQARSPGFERTLLFFPPDSIAGIETLLEAQVHGKTLIGSRNILDPLALPEILVKGAVDFLHVTPTFLNLLLVSGGLKREHLRSVRRLSYGSEPAQVSILRKILALKPELELRQIYGMSELGLLRTLTVKSDPSLFLLDEKANPYRLRDGLLEVKSESPMLGYLNAQSATHEGWFSTGDSVIQENGGLRVIGRQDDVINVAGKKFHPIQLEELLMQMPQIKDVMVTAEAHELIGQVVTAHVVTEIPDADFRALMKSFLEERVPQWMRPQKITLQKESTVTGRLKKRRKSSV